MLSRDHTDYLNLFVPRLEYDLNILYMKMPLGRKWTSAAQLFGNSHSFMDIVSYFASLSSLTAERQA